MCEIILEVFSREFLNNTNDILNLSSKTQKELEGKEIDGVITFDLTEIQNISDINDFVKLFIKRNQLVSKLKEDLDKEYTRNNEFIKRMDNIVKSINKKKKAKKK